jgi:segregation and condensation protein B
VEGALTLGDPILDPTEVPAGVARLQRTRALDAVLTDLRGDAREREQQLEALLFSTHVPLTTGEIARALGRSVEEVTAGLLLLERTIAERSTAVSLFIREKGGERAFILDLKAAYRKDAAAVAPPMLKPAVTETLALIAINQPLSQARLVRERGSTVYEHVKELMGRGLIQRQKKGRNYLLRTTDAFAAEFGLDNDPELIRRALARAAGVEGTPEVVGSPRVHIDDAAREAATSPEALVEEARAFVPPPPDPEAERAAAAALEAATPAREDEDCLVSGDDAPRAAEAEEGAEAAESEAPEQAAAVEAPVVEAPVVQAPVVQAPVVEAQAAPAPEVRDPTPAPSDEAPPPPSRIAHLLDLFNDQAGGDDW